MNLNKVTLGVALVISTVAAYFSIVGLTQLFAAAFWSVVIMATALEAGKIVAATWLHRHGKNISRWIKGYLLIAILILMVITSMGIFGLLSRAHIDQEIRSSTAGGVSVEQVDNKLEGKKYELDDVNLQIKQLDDQIARLRAANALEAIKKYSKDRDEKVAKRNAINEQMVALRSERIVANAEVKKIEAELGPIKYVAEWLFETSERSQLERAVRWVIILIIVSFDPLAIFLLMAVSQNMARAAEATKEEVKPTIIYRKRVGRPKGSKNKNRINLQSASIDEQDKPVVPEDDGPPEPIFDNVRTVKSGPEPDPNRVLAIYNRKPEVRFIQRDPPAHDLSKFVMDEEESQTGEDKL